MGGVTSTGLPRQPSARLNLWLVALALGLLAGCQEEGVWLFIDGVQCLTNPWEQDWLRNHNGDYPLNRSKKVAIFRDYYAGKGLAILDARLGGDGKTSSCLACGCSSGERYYALADGTDEGAFLDLGFEREDG